MKFKIDNDDNLYNRLREAGYHPDKLQRGDCLSFSRFIFGAKYPRFHLYYNEEKKEMNIHLDQKAPQYKSAPDHGAEYDGHLVKKEVIRLKSFL